MGFLLQLTSRVLAELFIFPKADIKTIEYRFNQLEPRNGQSSAHGMFNIRSLYSVHISSYSPF